MTSVSPNLLNMLVYILHLSDRGDIYSRLPFYTPIIPAWACNFNSWCLKEHFDIWRDSCAKTFNTAVNQEKG